MNGLLTAGFQSCCTFTTVQTRGRASCFKPFSHDKVMPHLPPKIRTPSIANLGAGDSCTETSGQRMAAVQQWRPHSLRSLKRFSRISVETEGGWSAAEFMI